MIGRCTLLGILDDGWAGLGELARARLAGAGLVIGASRTLALVQPHLVPGATARALDGALAEVPGWVRAAQAAGQAVVVLATGDPLCHGIGGLLIGKLGREVLDILPAPSTMQLAFARLGRPWQEARIASVHSRDAGEWAVGATPAHGLYPVVRAAALHPLVGVFTSPENSPRRIARALLAAGFGDDELRISVVARLLLPEEESWAGLSLAEAAGRDFPDPNVVVIERVGAAVSAIPGTWLATGVEGPSPHPGPPPPGGREKTSAASAIPGPAASAIPGPAASAIPGPAAAAFFAPSPLRGEGWGEGDRPSQIEMPVGSPSPCPLSTAGAREQNGAAGAALALPIFGFEDGSYAQRQPERGLLTKLEARAVSLAKLGLREDSVVWDIGAGSGSVGLEAARIARLGHVYAMEKNAADAANARENAARLRASNYTLVEGKAPAGLDVWPAPDAVFIGGSGGELAELIALCLARIRTPGRLVMNFITLENLAAATAALAAATQPAAADRIATSQRDALVATDHIAALLRWEVVQVQASRSQRILDMHRLAAQNPVWIVTAFKGG
jgi:precorrin-6y C5,15-methyltransferase (decarboxylating) CbiE subunit/precorrin-6Y C5,15-methyltransferase (decarboxylating) CbiT subunit